MSVTLNVVKVPKCPCGERMFFNISLYDAEAALLRRLQPGVHRRKLDGFCGNCRGPVVLDCEVTVKADGQGVIV